MPNEHEDAPLQPAQEVEQAAVEKAKQPETPAERIKRRHAETLRESDDQRSARRAKEMAMHYDVHRENVAVSHEKWPTGPATWMDPTDPEFNTHFLSVEHQNEERKRWNAKREEIDQHNKAYHLSVKRTFAEHQAEDQHIARSRAVVAKA